MAVDVRRLPVAREIALWRAVREAGNALRPAVINTIVSGLLALVVVVGMVVASIIGRDVDGTIKTISLLVVAYYFGQSTQVLTVKPGADPPKE